METRNFFSPFHNMTLDGLSGYNPFMVSLSLFSIKNKRTLLITIIDKPAIAKLKITSSVFASFSASTREGKSCLILEGTSNKSDGKIIKQKEYLQIKADNCTFLPKQNHKKKNLIAYYYDLRSDDQIIVIPVPDDYSLVPKYHRFQQSDQPEINTWPVIEK